MEEASPGGGKPVLHEPKYVSRMDVAVYQEAAKRAEENARAAWKQAEQRMQSAIDQFRSTYPTLIRFEYRLDKKAAQTPFQIAGMWHDGRFTYVRSHAPPNRRRCCTRLATGTLRWSPTSSPPTGSTS